MEDLVCALKFVVHFINNKESFKHSEQEVNLVVAMFSRELILQQWKISEGMSELSELSELEFRAEGTRTQRMVPLSGW